MKFYRRFLSCLANIWSFKEQLILYRMSGESHYLPSSYYTLQTSWLRTNNGAPQFPIHIFKAKQSIDSYENVCKLFRRKTHTGLVPSPRDFSWEVWNGKRETGRIYLTSPGHFLNIHLGHGATDHSFEIMLSDPEGQTTTPHPKVKQWSVLYILCFTKMKNLRRAVNPRPGWYPPDLEPPQYTHETCIVSMHRRDALQSQAIQTPTTTCKVNNISTWTNDAWWTIDLRLSKTSILPHGGDGAQVTWVLIFLSQSLGEFIILAFDMRRLEQGQVETLPLWKRWAVAARWQVRLSSRAN